MAGAGGRCRPELELSQEDLWPGPGVAVGAQEGIVSGWPCSGHWRDGARCTGRCR